MLANLGDPSKLSRTDLASMIDHTLLRADATSGDIQRLCSEARAHGFGAVCVNPAWVGFAGELLRESGVVVCAVVDFPLGASGTRMRTEAARQAVIDGAGELDVVLPVGRLRGGDDAGVREDLDAVVDAAGGKPVKVILETALLDEDQIDRACAHSQAAGAAFVKTSTGFGPAGATVAAVARMRTAVGDALGVKASGGIRDAGTARAMIDAGATRLGTSASVEIVTTWEDDR